MTRPRTILYGTIHALQEIFMPQSNTTNRQILLASRPVGAPGPDNFKLVENSTNRADVTARIVDVARPLYARPHE